MKAKINLISLVGIFLAVAALWGEIPPYRISLEEVLSIGSLNDDTLYMWTALVVDEQACIYVVDAMDYSLKKFDASGRLIDKTGQKGQGPGEFLAPRLLAAGPDLLFATDQSISGIQVFDLNLKFLKKIPFDRPISSLHALSDREIFILPYTADQGGKVLKIDPDGRILKEIVYAEASEVMLMNSASLEIDAEENLYLAYSFQDKIVKLDDEGNLLWTRNLLDVDSVRTERIQKITVPTKVTYNDIARDRTGRLYILGGHLADNPGRDVTVLSADGMVLAAFPLPESSHCLYIDERGFLYSRANEGISLKKYRLDWIQQ